MKITSVIKPILPLKQLEVVDRQKNESELNSFIFSEFDCFNWWISGSFKADVGLVDLDLKQILNDLDLK